MRTITFPLDFLREALRELAEGASDRVLRLPVGIMRLRGGIEYLVRPQDSAATHMLAVTLRREPSARIPPPDCSALLCFGTADAKGRVSGVAATADGVASLDQVRLVGAGMHVLTLAASPREDAGAALADTYSRTIGALGREVWERLRRLRFGIVGVGRSGFQVARLLAGLGCRELVLIDPDVIEPHNLGEMPGLPDDEVGSAKVHAVSRALLGPDMSVRTVRGSITRLRALRAAKTCDVLVGCVDHDSARLALALLAALYHKPLLDIASGIHRDDGRPRFGATVRLVLPGRCLLCLGGLGNETGARDALSSPRAESSMFENRNWRRERAGSLASLNTLAAAAAVRMVEDLVGERIEQSRWTQLKYDREGRLHVDHPEAVRPDSACTVCGLSGAGDAGLDQAPSVLAAS